MKTKKISEAAKRGKRNKAKGNRFELEIVHKLIDAGYSGCMSSRRINKMADANKIDIVDTKNELPVNIQTKYTQNTPNYFDIRSGCTDTTKPFCVIWKKAMEDNRNSPGTIAMIDIDYFINLIKK